MKRILLLCIISALSISTSLYSQCKIEVDNNGFEYNVSLDLSVTDVIYTQFGSTCNVEIEVTYSISIDVVNQPGWWNESLYTLQGNLDCAGASGMSFFNLPNSGGNGAVLSATFSVVGNCNEVDLDCPIIIQIEGPELNQNINCGTYMNLALPVTISDFEYDRNQNEIELKWKTYSEINFSHFELQESKNLKDWKTLTVIYGQNAEKNSNYKYETSTLETLSYYRLKMIDFDDQYRYSKILAVPGHISDELKIYPNPASNRLFLDNVNSNEAVIINNLGQISNLKINRDHSIDLGGLTQGQYIIKIKESTGNFRTSRFFKL